MAHNGNHACIFLVSFCVKKLRFVTQYLELKKSKVDKLEKVN